jgi:nucleoside-diphosphate-sugar epimerase
MVRSLMGGRETEIRTPESVRDYIYIEDLARAAILLVERRFQGTINLGTGEGVSVRAIAEGIVRLLGKSELIRFPAAVSTASSTGAASAAETGARWEDRIVADATRIRGLGWRPEIDLDTGLRRLVRSLTA